MTSRTIENLPLEIISNIATHCDVDTVLALTLASKTLRRASHDPIVLRSIVWSMITKQPPRSQDEDDQKSPFQLLNLSQQLGEDAGAWLRYVVAISRALSLEKASLSSSREASKLQVISAHQIEQYLSYMPQLLCLGYTQSFPCCVATAYSERANNATRVLQTRNVTQIQAFPFPLRRRLFHTDQDPTTFFHLVQLPSKESEARFAFCFAIEMLSRDYRGGGGRGADSTIASPGLRPRFFDVVRHENDYNIALSGILRPILLDHAHDCSQFWQQQNAQLMVGAFAYALRLREGEPHPFFRPRIKFPPVSAFPLISSASPNLPLPFVGRAKKNGAEPAPPSWSWTDCLEEHLNDLASTESLESGEWCGYSSIGVDLSQFARPMEHIRLCVGEENGITRQLTGEGTDHIGHFTLDGDLAARPYHHTILSMSKRYDGGDGWAWHGALTPFGFVGTWREGFRPRERPLGMFWIWKTEWMEEVTD